MAGSIEAQREWVAAVLGVKLSPKIQVAKAYETIDIKRLRAAVAAFHDAIGAVGTQIAGIQDALRATGHPVLKKIADQGLSGLMAGMRVNMSAALLELLQAPAAQREQRVKVARTFIRKLSGFVQSDQLFGLFDTNPLGVQINSRKDLLAALATLDHEIAESAS